jgi:hypothetical protein
VAAFGLLALIAVLLWPGTIAAAPIPVRFVEGISHGFLVLRTLNGELIAPGELVQTIRGSDVDSRMVFHFKDGSMFDETVIFSQDGVFTMQNYHLVQRGPLFPEDTEVRLDRSSGKYRVTTKSHKSGKEEVLEGALDLPPDVYNGMVLTVAKNLLKDTRETVHFVAFMPKPMLIRLKLWPEGVHKVMVGDLEKTAIHYVFRAKLGSWLTYFAKLFGRTPPDYHAWILTDEVPAFVKFEGPLYTTGPVWRIELMSPSWPE